MRQQQNNQPDEHTTLASDVQEYLHWRKVNPQIKGGENYLRRLRQSLSIAQKRESSEIFTQDEVDHITAILFQLDKIILSKKFHRIASTLIENEPTKEKL